MPAASIAERLKDTDHVDVVAFPGGLNPNPGLRALRPPQARFHLDGGAFYSDRPGPSQWLRFDSPFPRLRSSLPPRRSGRGPAARGVEALTSTAMSRCSTITSTAPPS